MPALAAGTTPIFACFFAAGSQPVGAKRAGLHTEPTRRTRYRVQEVNDVRGPSAGAPVSGEELVRIESPGGLALPSAPFVGVTQHVLYTSANARNALSRVSRAESGPCAVLIPITKSAQWWALAQDERQAFLRASAPGHVDIGLEYAGEIYRRLYHARMLPGSAWDFLTYFEFPMEAAGRFKELLARLRDVRQNPEWSFVEREVEIWMTKSDT
jgi:hypothetical protein